MPPSQAMSRAAAQDPDVSALRIDIDTRGVVTLTGIVNSPAQKSRAVELAGKADNVVAEDNLLLQEVPPSAR